MTAMRLLARRTAWATATSGLALAPSSMRHRTLATVIDPLGFGGIVLWEDAASDAIDADAAGTPHRELVRTA